MRRAQNPGHVPELVGRQGERDWILDAATDRRWPGVLLSGSPGIGSSALARTVASCLAEAGRAVTLVRPSRGTSEVPLGALAPLLGSSRPEDVTGLVLRQVGDHIAGDGGGVVVVDDAQHLDRVSSAVLVQLVHDHRLQIIATAKPTQRGESAAVASLLEVGLERRAVPPLEEAASVELFLALTPEADRATAQAAHQRAAGRPFLVAAQADPQHLTALHLAVSGWLSGLDEATVGAAQCVAAANGLPVHLVAQLSGQRAVVGLERSGLARTVTNGRRLRLELHPPLLNDVLWERSGVAERHLLLRSLAEAAAHLPRRRTDDALFAVQLATRGGPVPAPTVLSKAGRHAVTASDGALARTVIDLTEAGDEVTGFSFGPSADGSPSASLERVELELVDAHLAAIGQGRPQLALEVARAVCAHGSADTRAVVLAESLICDVDADLDPVQATAGRAAELLDRAMAAGLSLPTMASLASYCSSLLGRADNQAGWRLKPTTPLDGAGQLLVHSRLELSRLVDSLLAGNPGRPTRTPDPGSTCSILVDGLLAAARGDLQLASHHLGAARRACDAGPPWSHHLVVDLTALLAAELGDATGRSTPGGNHAHPHRAGWLRTDGIRVVASVWATGRGGGPQIEVARETRQRLVHLVGSTGELGFALLGVVVLCRFDAVAGVEDLVVELDDTLAVPLGRLVRGCGLALSEGAPEPVAAAAVELARCGLRPFAAETFEYAAQRAGHRGAATEANRYRLHRDVLLSAAASPVLGRPRAVLSGREAEILSLLDPSRSNRDLASSLFLSRRTVENHLSRIYRRLGVADRHELIELRDTTLRLLTDHGPRPPAPPPDASVPSAPTAPGTGCTNDVGFTLETNRADPTVVPCAADRVSFG